jgi:protein tyrosine phosphatase
VEYIASQGPTADTAEDFWRMVFEKDVCVIAMVTNLQEKGKVKCHKYFPGLTETMRLERIAVKCTSHSDFPVFTKRTFIIQETHVRYIDLISSYLKKNIYKGEVVKSVTHMHFRGWPDFGCPKSTNSLINFCQSMRENSSKAPGDLILVHCRSLFIT